jgi:H/ACA ribonucleoprotein complex subunit 2
LGGARRLVVLAGDISPLDVITHLPLLCEEAGVPYVYVPSKEDLGLAGATKRPTSVIMVTPKSDADFKEAYDEVYTTVQALPVPV